MKAAHTMMLDVFMLLLIVLLLEPLGANNTSNLEIEIQPQSNKELNRDGIQMNMLTLMITPNAYIHKGLKINLATIEKLIEQEDIIGLRYSVQPDSLYRDVQKLTKMASKHHLKIFEVIS